MSISQHAITLDTNKKKNNLNISTKNKLYNIQIEFKKYSLLRYAFTKKNCVFRLLLYLSCNLFLYLSG